MFEELSQIIKNLPEEDQKNFIEKAKLQAQTAVKTAAERIKKEEEKKMFKATGHWQTEDENGFKAEIEVSEEDKKNITFKLSDQNEETQFSLSKKEFFNFFKLIEDAHSSLKEEGTSLNDDVWTNYISDIAKSIANASTLVSNRRPRFRAFRF